MFKAVVFDLDGTLIDSARDLQNATNAALASLDLDPIDQETATGFVGNGVETLVRRAFAFRGATPDEDAFRTAMIRFRTHYDAHGTDHTTPYPGVLKMLQGLGDAGLKMGICTNKPEAPARQICQHLGLGEYVTTIVGGDTLPSRKPDPEPLSHAIRLLGVGDADTLYVGDSGVDHATAKAAGVAFAYFTGGHQRGEIDNYAPDFEITAMSQVTDIVLK